MKLKSHMHEQREMLPSIIAKEVSAYIAVFGEPLWTHKESHKKWDHSSILLNYKNFCVNIQTSFHLVTFAMVVESKYHAYDERVIRFLEATGKPSKEELYDFLRMLEIT